MALANPPFPVTAMANALLASTVMQTIGITTTASIYYGQTSTGAAIYVPSPANMPAVLIETTFPGGGRRIGFNSGTGAGTTTYHGAFDLTIYLAPTDYGALETYAWNLLDDLIGQGGANLNIQQIDIVAVTLPSPDMQAGSDQGQQGMPTVSCCTIELHVVWED